MKRLLAFAFVLILVPLMAAVPASAELYFVALSNGATFETVHPPQEASWDSDTILILSEVGNWIGLERDQIESITTQTEFKGFGITINDTTIFMGIAPNDNVIPGEEGEGEPTAADRLLDLLESQNSQPSFTVEQFVGTDDPGSGGVPLGYIGGAIGSTGDFSEPIGDN